MRSEMWRDFNWMIEQHFDQVMQEELAKNDSFKGFDEPVAIMSEAARRTYQRIWDEKFRPYWKQKFESVEQTSGAAWDTWDEGLTEEFMAEAIKHLKAKAAAKK